MPTPSDYITQVTVRVSLIDNVPVNYVTQPVVL